MKKVLLSILFFLSIFQNINAQAYDDYIGAGHSRDIIITSSSAQQQDGWTQTASADKTVDGAGMEGKLAEAARFLTQAALRHDMQEIEHVAELGIEEWIDEQISQPAVLHLPIFYNTLQEYIEFQEEIGIPDTLIERRHIGAIQMSTYWRMNMLERDFLRDKIALAWSEILVVSRNSILSPYGTGIMDYLDVFKRNAFGNFYDILREITLHPTMGWYLSHYANEKANPTLGTSPDENFAREVMQLFTIGLYQLNNDGSHQLDAAGNTIPTYKQEDVQQMAKVFTGLGTGGTISDNLPVIFKYNYWAMDWTAPMLMYENKHETEEKTLFEGDLVLPAGQPGMTDIDAALTYLFNHQNTPPFICQRMIQLFVKSNPTPAYVERVSNAFINDGNGVRGNMEAVFKAILLDVEARDCSWINHPTQGKLKNPTEKYIQFTQVVEITSERDQIWMDGALTNYTTNHSPVAAPSVFNFHERDHMPFGQIKDEGMVAPEFQILDSNTAMGYAQLNDRWFHLFNRYGRWGSDDVQSPGLAMTPIFDAYLEASQDNEVLINMLDMRLTNGNLSAHTRMVLKNFLDSMEESYFPLPAAHLAGYAEEKIKHAIAFIMLSPDFNIIR